MEKCDKCIWSTRSGGCSSWNCNFVDKHEAYEAWQEKHEKEEVRNE